MTKIPTHKKGTTGNQHKTTSYDNSNYYDQVSSNIHNSLGTQAAALGDTAKDGIAGEKIDSVTGLGDSKVNSSIGSQWRHGRVQSIESQVKSNYGIPPKTIDNIPDSAIMNINLF
ncbi:polymorphic toxin type 15 domain-containing protein [Tenacibaculum maritimum]|uniref:polymorphic toxin type 15 domain-containing protein n=1 Tax=Tenacibaculum maritimum TaxID=107401 RepID=UPI00132FA01B|nr:polymorphic toxin type 15 domain-containing protein [Tenacibaculum maritimum]